MAIARPRLRGLLALLLSAAATQCAAQQLVVGSGARFNLGSSVIDAGCRDVQVTGTLEIGAGTLTGARNLAVPGALRGGSGVVSLSGDLAAAGTLVPETGTVRISDGCGSSESRVTGNHQFHRLLVQTSAAHALVLPAGGTQAIAGALELIGGIDRLVLRSSASGLVSLLSLAVGGMQTVNRVDAIDVGAPPSGQFLAPQLAATYDSIDRGNTPRFFGDQPIIPVPALSSGGLAALLLLISGIALIQLRTLTRGHH